MFILDSLIHNILLCQLAAFQNWVKVYMRKILSWRFHADHPLGIDAVYHGAIPVGHNDGLTDMTWGQD